MVKLVLAVAATLMLVAALAGSLWYGVRRLHEERLQRFSQPRRGKNTSYDLFAKSDAAPTRPSRSSSKTSQKSSKRHRTSSEHREKIDLFPKASEEPPSTAAGPDVSGTTPKEE